MYNNFAMQIIIHKCNKNNVKSPYAKYYNVSTNHLSVTYIKVQTNIFFL